MFRINYEWIAFSEYWMRHAQDINGRTPTIKLWRLHTNHWITRLPFFFFLSLSVFAIVYILVLSLLFTFFSYIFIFFFIFVAASNAIQRLIINFLILRSRLRFHAKVQLYCIFQCNHLFHSIRNRSQPRWYYHIRNNSIIIWMRHSFLAFDQYSCPLNVLPLICSLCL